MSKTRCVTKENPIYKAAIYPRLSRQDGDDAVSYSIKNQIQMLTDFVGKNPDIKLVSTVIDDGASGVNFNRKGFNEIMRLIEKGEINCLIVKDNSRLGRNFTEVERYTNVIFPHYGVRYISIAENIDSNREKTFNERISEPVINLSNEFHVAQTSQKTRNCLAAKRKHGEFVNNFAVFGYFKNGKTIEKYEEAAEIVRLIFKLKIDGLSNQSIANELNKRKILSPLEYKKSKGSNYKTAFKQHKTALWSGVSVKRILENPVYSGVLILGKTTSRNYKDKRRFAKDADKLDVFENLHAPIVSKTEFNLVRQLLEMDLWSVSGKSAYPLSGLATCGNCGEKLYRDKKTNQGETYYYCRNKECKARACINEKHLNKAVCSALKTQISYVLEIEKLFNNVCNTSVTAEKILLDDKRIEFAEREIGRLEHRKLAAFSAKLLPENEREKLIKEYEFQIAERREFILALRKNTEKLLASNSREEWLERVKQFADFKELTRAVAVSLIEKISVLNSDSIEIVFRRASNFKKL